MARGKARMPAFTDTVVKNPAELTRKLRAAMQAMEERLASLEKAVQIGYSVVNGTTKRDLDVTGATLTETKQILGTLIQDLKTRGDLG